MFLWGRRRRKKEERRKEQRKKVNGQKIRKGKVLGSRVMGAPFVGTMLKNVRVVGRGRWRGGVAGGVGWGGVVLLPWKNVCRRNALLPLF